ncbi:MAG: type II toxin-antitoxin system mRNA interferase toxin, RelE/StbE family [Alphaproteobacteria bacterium CG11_big_fil_rev_8_21_14_0_20_44_7]|nr:MAG: type II toxin-antitoxin system mRNA interferase toxin, RelE/StbE family [Alphaproteobacteria bacterium CG11_big_fil_rev_8_21_14_0_20_44_7]
MSDYQIIFPDNKAFEKQIRKLPKPALIRILKEIESKLASNPIKFGKPLRHNLIGLRRLRVGDYRIIYRIEDEKVIVTTIQHRKDVYEG